MAYQYWRQRGRPEKRRFAALSEGYHGDTVGSVSVGGIDLFHQTFRGLLFEVERIPSPGDCAEASLAAAEQLFSAKGGELAALVIEPLVQGAAGMLVQPAGFLAQLAQLCRRHEVLLVCDEVATGFGRTGTLFAVEQCGVRPDLLCLGKGITGGYLPMSATVASGRVFEAFLGPDLSERTFYHGHSYSGNALAAAVATRHLELFDEWRVLDNVAERTEQLSGRLAETIGPLHAVREVRQKGMMVGVELDPPSEGLRWGRSVSAASVRRGVLVRPLGDVIVLMPILTSTADEIDTIVETLAEAIAEGAVA
jgi:adenosylmethionine---8-amino-7-oxononanoate aminotransferase